MVVVVAGGGFWLLVVSKPTNSISTFEYQTLEQDIMSSDVSRCITLHKSFTSTESWIYPIVAAFLVENVYIDRDRERAP